MNRNNGLEQTVVICAFATLIALIWFSFAYSNNEKTQYVIAGIDKWQPLIAGIAAAVAALIAAKWTVGGIQNQIEEAQQTRRDLEMRSFRAARSKLPRALSETKAYAEACLYHLRPIMEHYASKEAEGNLPHDVRPSAVPRFPVEAEEKISELIATCPANLNAGYHLALLLSAMQINHSRFTGLYERSKTTGFVRDNLYSHMSDAVEIRRVADKFISFARDEEQDTNLDDAFLDNPGAAYNFLRDVPPLIENEASEYYYSNIKKLKTRNSPHEANRTI